MTATTYANPSEDLVLVVTRIFDAPRELVFKMFTDPKHLARFWGPTGYTSTVLEMDPRPGGTFRLRVQTAAYIHARPSIERSSSPSGSSTSASRTAAMGAAADCLRARS